MKKPSKSPVEWIPNRGYGLKMTGVQSSERHGLVKYVEDNL